MPRCLGTPPRLPPQDHRASSHRLLLALLLGAQGRQLHVRVCECTCVGMSERVNTCGHEYAWVGVNVHTPTLSVSGLDSPQQLGQRLPFPSPPGCVGKLAWEQYPEGSPRRHCSKSLWVLAHFISQQPYSVRE